MLCIKYDQFTRLEVPEMKQWSQFVINMNLHAKILLIEGKRTCITMRNVAPWPWQQMPQNDAFNCTKSHILHFWVTGLFHLNIQAQTLKHNKNKCECKCKTISRSFGFIIFIKILFSFSLWSAYMLARA